MQGILSVSNDSGERDLSVVDASVRRAGGLSRWLDRPQTAGLRRALLKIHLWVALMSGLYLIVISLSGSAVVFRRELNSWLVPREVPSMTGSRLSADALEQAVRQAYVGHEVTSISEQPRPERPVYVRLERDGVERQRLFDPYTGTDLGDAWPLSLQVVEWLVDLHDNLLLDRETGRFINGIGGALLFFLVATGLVLWWPGRGRWLRSLVVWRPTPVRPFVWQLHSALGFWSLGILAIWALTGVYFAWPEPFEAVVDAFDSDLTDFERPDAWLQQSVRLHFGRFGGLGIRWLWVTLGLIPAVMFVTGFMLWLRRRPNRAAPAQTGHGPRVSER